VGGEQAHLRRFIDIIAKKWAILIIRIIVHFEKIRSKESMQKFDGISSKTLTDVVKDLKKENLIHRESFSEIPP
jgi:DNA-binding HxlR family transcriptional regulator